ncbi:MAG: pitrilysin family protein [Gammaproteobacteria bacterium]
METSAVRPYRFNVFCGLLLALPGVGFANTPAHEFRLDNGLELIVQEDHRAPVAVVQVWYRVGSAYEHDGITGVSHALEHMMFKETKNLATGEFSELVAARGGRENAFTSTDYTAYFQQWAAENVEESFRLEAERMQNLVISDEEFTKEINVVLEERRLRTDDNPQALASEAARAVAFQTSPYRQPVIGWAADIQQMTADDLRRWYERWYVPNNAIVVVVGDVDPAAVHVLAKKHFGPIEARPFEPRPARPEVPQRGIKRLDIVSEKARNPYLVMGFKTPVLRQAVMEEGVEEWEIYALEVLAETLDGDDSARLQQNLVRGRELASHIDAGFSAAAMLPGLFYFSAIPRDGVELAVLEQAVLDEIDRVRTSPPSADELERIKAQVVASHVFERDSMQHQAIIIGSLAAVGLDWRLKDSYVEKIHAVTADQVRAVVDKYFHPATLTVAHLLPEEAP